jgi:hypothetical protein
MAPLAKDLVTGRYKISYGRRLTRSHRAHSYSFATDLRTVNLAKTGANPICQNSMTLGLAYQLVLIAQGSGPCIKH